MATPRNSTKKTKQNRTNDFDLNDPTLTDEMHQQAILSGNYPYENKMKKKEYEKELEVLQIELVKLQTWSQQTDSRILCLFEGRDAAGKGGSINAFRRYLNPRHARVVALPKPTDVERGQWYFQRYSVHFPSSGEIVLFDRSWYNRAGVEPVMGFCTANETKQFLKETPQYERLLVNDGIHFFKFWLNIGREMQLLRFHERRHNPLKTWKLSPIDLASLDKWDAYTKARNHMLEETHKSHAPWVLLRANCKRRARLNLIRHVLSMIDYEGRDKTAIGKIDDKILGFGPDFLKNA